MSSSMLAAQRHEEARRYEAKTDPALNAPYAKENYTRAIRWRYSCRNKYMGCSCPLPIVTVRCSMMPSLLAPSRNYVGYPFSYRELLLAPVYRCEQVKMESVR